MDVTDLQMHRRAGKKRLSLVRRRDFRRALRSIGSRIEFGLRLPIVQLGSRRVMRSNNCLLASNVYGRYCVPRASKHRPAARSIRLGEVWEPKTLLFLRSIDSESDIVHAGAYFGDFLPGLSSSRSRDGQVNAFEPNYGNFCCATTTIELNALTNVHLANVALGSSESTGTLRTVDRRGRQLGGSSHLVMGENHYRHETVQIIRGDSLLDPKRRVGGIHLDVENYEEASLSGLLGTIRRWLPVLVLESVPSKEFMESELQSIGYRVIRQIEGNTVLSAKD